MTGVYLEVDGNPIPIRDCSWLLVAPCGCVAGLHVAESHGNEGPLTTPEQAMIAFTPNTEQRRRDIAAGWTTRLCGDRGVAVAAFAAPDGSDMCPHDPKWGEEPKPERDGWVWASARRTRRSHLIPVRENGEYWRTSTALCGAEHWGWEIDAWAVADMPTCRKCEAAAAEPEQAVAS